MGVCVGTGVFDEGIGVFEGAGGVLVASVGVWVVTMFMSLESETLGQIQISEVISDESL